MQGTSRLLRFETRLALSASATADVLMDLWDIDPLSGGQADDASSSQTLMDQAQDIFQNYGLDGSGQTVAVIDSGIAYDHVALGGGFGPGYRVVGGWDFAENDANPYDDGPSGFHGTHVAGTLAGSSDSFSGIAPGADLVALRVFDDYGGGNLDWIEDALAWVHENRFAFENPITAVNLSLGSVLPAEMASQIQAQLEDELSLLKADGIMVFAAAGNAFDADAPSQLAYPAASPSVTPVGSIAGDGSLSSFSQRTDGILVAPGELVNSSVPDHVLGRDGRIDDFVNATGTSMASPQIAGAAVLVREAMLSAGLDADGGAVLDHLYDTADRSTDDATGLTYYQINLTRAIEQLIVDGGGEEPTEPPAPTDPPVIEPEPIDAPVEDLGSIQWTQTELETGQWYTVDAERDGLLSIVRGDESEAALPIVIERVVGDTIVESGSATQRQFDVNVQAGETIRFRIDSSVGSTLAVEIANLVSVSDGQARFTGTDASDQVEIDLRNDAMLRFGNFEYHFSHGEISNLQILGGGGNDTVNVIGSEAVEKVTLRVGSGEIENASLLVQMSAVEKVSIEGGGGSDRAYLYDSSGNDTLSASPGDTKLSGVGFEHTVTGIRSIYVHATAGGNDTAYLYDSTGDDRLAIRPEFTSLRGDDFLSLVYGFDRVNAYGTAGGNDTADLYDSAGDDRMSANATNAYISGPGYYSQARHFESVVGHATAGGIDHATIYADSADQTLHNIGGLVQLDAGGGAVRAAQGFEIAETFLNGSPIIVAPQALAVEIDSDPIEEPEYRGVVTLDEDPTERSVSQRANEIMGLAQSRVQGPSDDEERDLLDQLFAEL
ncbi:S8 family peptidase [Rosistilla carotiformis]|nr:S8 family serine peptidase [Rosistilla carotiformis]